MINAIIQGVWLATLLLAAMHIIRHTINRRKP